MITSHVALRVFEIIMKIPGLKEERKKPKQPKTIPIYDDATGTSVDMFVPPSYKEVKEQGRNWTNIEVQQIIKLQSKIHGLGSAFSVKAFYDLWNNSEHVCSITGVDFSQFDQFNIGIYRANIHSRYHRSNYKLMLLPLAYTLTNYKRQRLVIENFEKYLTDIPFAKCILQQLCIAVKDCKLFKQYFLTVAPITDIVLSKRGISFTSVVLNMPTSKFYSASDVVRICEVIVDDVRSAISISINRVVHCYISLADPTIDFRQEFIKILVALFKNQLYSRSHPLLY